MPRARAWCPPGPTPSSVIPCTPGALIYLLGTPLALGSYWGLAAPALMTPILIWRLVDEERVLDERLPGYSDYKRKVRYRLLPGVY